jgi:bacterioferritin B
MARRRLSEERALPPDFMRAPGVPPAPPGGRNDGPVDTAGSMQAPITGTPMLPPLAREPHVIGKRLRRLVVAQIRVELAGQQTSLGISLYFERENLVAWARRFRERSAAAFARGTRLSEILAANQVEFDLPMAPVARTLYRSPARALRAALEHDRTASEQLSTLARAAASKGDAETLLAARWLMGQHVAEERETRRLRDLVASGVNLFQAEPLLEPGSHDTDGAGPS